MTVSRPNGLEEHVLHPVRLLNSLRIPSITHNTDAVNSIKIGLVPGSDMAGEVVAIGEDVKEWRVGDRVCPNFSPDHIYGDVTPAIQAKSLGAIANGVLTEYKAFYSHVCFSS